MGSILVNRWLKLIPGMGLAREVHSEFNYFRQLYYKLGEDST
jgi:hypothetical protein